MSADERPDNDLEHTTIAVRDLRLLYAKINAHESIIKAMVLAVQNAVQDKGQSFEMIRATAMEAGDLLDRPEGVEDTSFFDQGRLETLRFIAALFSAISAG